MRDNSFIFKAVRCFLFFAVMLILTGQLQAQEITQATTEKSQAIDEAADELSDLLLSVAGHVTITFKDTDTTVLGDIKTMQVKSEVAGRLILIDIDSEGNIVQLYPNRYTQLDRWKIGSGDTIFIPDTPDYRIRAAEPTGKNKILAIVVPSKFDDKALVTSPSRLNNDLSVESDPQAYLKTLNQLIRKSLGSNNKGLVIEPVPDASNGWAFGYKDYFVTKDRESQNDYFIDDEHPTSQIFLEPVDKSMDSSRAIMLREVYEKGLNLTKLSEGFREHMYHDAARFCTIAYGHLIKKAACDGRPEEFARGVTEPRGEEILKVDMGRAKTAVSVFSKGELTDGQYAALADFTFNVGTGNFKKSTLLKLVNRRHFNRVPLEFRKWVKAGGKVFRGLQKRREREIALFFDGKPVPSTKAIGPAEMIDIRVGEEGE